MRTITREPHPSCTGRGDRAPIPAALSGLYQITRTLDVVAPPAGDGSPRPVSLVWRGETGVRGMPTLVRNGINAGVHEPPEVLLRIHPGVSFDFQNLTLSVAEQVEGCLDVVCDAGDPQGRRGTLRRVTLRGGTKFQLRITETDRSLVRRMFLLDGCALECMVEVPSLCGLQLNAGTGVMLRVSDTGMGTAGLRDVIPWTPETEFQSTANLTGGSVLFDSLLFHQNVGPRPSRTGDLRLKEPDGQDVFLGLPSTTLGRQGTHLTMIQCESQSWWLLSRDSRVTQAHQVVLLGVAHANVNWGGYNENFSGVRRAAVWGIPAPDTTQQPPSVVWLGSVGQCVLIGSRLDQSVVIDDTSTVVNVGTVFYRGPSGTYTHGTFQPVANMSTRDTLYQAPARLFVPFDRAIRRLVPILEEP